jgi:hypothetical protein
MAFRCHFLPLHLTYLPDVVFWHCPHLLHPCTQDQTGGSFKKVTVPSVQLAMGHRRMYQEAVAICSPAPPLIGTGYLRWVPVMLEQWPQLVSVTIIISFRCQRRYRLIQQLEEVGWEEGLKDGLEKKMAMEANVQVRLGAEKC